MEGATVIRGWKESSGIEGELHVQPFWLEAILVLMTQLDQSLEA